MISQTMKTLSYAQRAHHAKNPTAKQLLTLMAEKKTNLCVSLDIVTKNALLEMADLLGPEICVLKTHIDIVEDFDIDLTHQLQQLADKHQFLIFEDRKFADIGNTVALQYGGGIYRMADWAHIVNAHTLPGPGIVEGLKTVGLAQQRGLLLLAQMSPKGNLLNAEYTRASVAMAEAHADFVIGFICVERLSDNPALIHFTPGVHLASSGDHLGQQYISPTQAIARGTDVVIVGRGIYGDADPLQAAKRYRDISWQAYSNLLNS